MGVRAVGQGEVVFGFHIAYVALVHSDGGCLAEGLAREEVHALCHTRERHARRGTAHGVARCQRTLHGDDGTHGVHVVHHHHLQHIDEGIGVHLCIDVVYVYDFARFLIGNLVVVGRVLRHQQLLQEGAEELVGLLVAHVVERLRALGRVVLAAANHGHIIAGTGGGMIIGIVRTLVEENVLGARVVEEHVVPCTCIERHTTAGGREVAGVAVGTRIVVQAVHIIDACTYVVGHGVADGAIELLVPLILPLGVPAHAPQQLQPDVVDGNVYLRLVDTQVEVLALAGNRQHQECQSRQQGMGDM